MTGAGSLSRQRASSHERVEPAGQLMLRLLWNIDPVLLHLGPLEVRWYGLLFAGGILAAYQVGAWSFERAGGSREEANRLLGYVVIGTVVGARLGHCLLYEPGYYLRHPLEILAIWRGGLASHGGAAGIAVAVWLFARRTRRDIAWLLDRVAVAAPIAAASIRVGNLFNSEIIGRPSMVPWAVVFARVDYRPRHPAMLYEAAAYLVILAVMLCLERRTELRDRPGALTGLLLVLVFGIRFVIEFLKEPQEAFEAALPLDMGQLLSLPGILIGILLLGLAHRRSPWKEGPDLP
jgi:phosphatidylglycerol---prolipoprotein diacylglyceryl transferase